MPDWAKTALLAMIAFTGRVILICLGGPGLKWAFQAIAGRARFSSEIVGQVAYCITTVPEGVLFGGPVVAILVELRTNSMSKWVWTESVGAATAVLALSNVEVISGYPNLVNGADPLASTRLTVNALRLVVVALGSWFIVDRIGWAGTTSNRP